MTLKEHKNINSFKTKKVWLTTNQIVCKKHQDVQVFVLRIDITVLATANSTHEIKKVVHVGCRLPTKFNSIASTDSSSY